MPSALAWSRLYTRCLPELIRQQRVEVVIQFDRDHFSHALGERDRKHTSARAHFQYLVARLKLCRLDDRRQETAVLQKRLSQPLPRTQAKLPQRSGR